MSIAQVVGNLISNAIRHTPAGGVISVRGSIVNGPCGKTYTPGRCLQIAVADTGSGIPAEAVPHIFDRFYRAARSDMQADQGSGLGLAIAKKLVEAHWGRIWATSVVGQGTTVSFTLPLS